MSVESDGIEESFEGTVRTAVTVAGRVGEQLARVHEENLFRARAQSAQAGREYGARLHAEREAARAQFAPVHREEWWVGAGADAIGKAYTTARVWEDLDPEAFRAASRIRTEVRDRYGIDVDAALADPAAVQAALARAAALRLEADSQHSQSREDTTTGGALIAEADRIDRRAENARLAGADDREGDVLSLPGPALIDVERAPAQDERARTQPLPTDGSLAYDTAERRQAMADGLEGKADAETVRARVVADTSQARHPREAVLIEPATATTTRRRARSVQQQRGRSELER